MNDIFNTLYLKYRKLMFHVANQILQNDADAEDAVQLALLKISENAAKLSDIDSPKTKGYIITVTENKAIDIYRQNLRHRKIPVDDETLHFTVSYEGDDTFTCCILALPTLYRHIIMLKHYYGYNTREISHLMDISLANTYKTEQRAKRMLEELCKKEGVLE